MTVILNVFGHIHEGVSLNCARILFRFFLFCFILFFIIFYLQVFCARLAEFYTSFFHPVYSGKKECLEANAE